MFVKSDYHFRSMEESDKAQIRHWRNQSHVRQVMFTDHLISNEEHDEWFKKAFNSVDSVHLILEHMNDPVAFVYFTSIDRINSKCQWGFYLTSLLHPRGTGSLMAWFSLDWCFATMGMRKLSCESFAFNKKAVSIYQKFGFAPESCSRSLMVKKGFFYKVLGFSLLAQEWLQVRGKLEKSLFI